MALNWTGDMESGNSILDAENKKFAEAMNDLEAACKDGEEKEQIERTLAFLEEFAEAHLTREEERHKGLGYPHIEEQKKFHDEFREHLKNLKAQIARDTSDVESLGKAHSAAARWLYRHIREEDAKIAKILEEEDRMSGHYPK